MADIVGLIIGAVLLFGGFTLLVSWWPMFIHLVMGGVPVFLMMVGAAILIYYISEIKSKSELKKEENTNFREVRIEEM